MGRGQPVQSAVCLVLAGKTLPVSSQILSIDYLGGNARLSALELASL